VNKITALYRYSVIRWFVVGCTTFVIDITLFVGLYYTTHLSIWSNVLSGLCATLFNYSAHYRWSFESNQKHFKSSLYYLITFFTFLALTTYSIKILISLDIHPSVAKICTALLAAPFSFAIMKFVTFRRNSFA